MSISFDHIEQEISSMLSIPAEELTPEQQAEIDNYLSELAQAETDKVDHLCSWMKAELARAEACKAEAKRLSAKAKTIESRIDWLRHQYAETMFQHGVKKINGDVYSVTYRTSVSSDIVDESQLPDAYKHSEVTVKIDKASILKDLKAGQVVPGARMIERSNIMFR